MNKHFSRWFQPLVLVLSVLAFSLAPNQVCAEVFDFPWGDESINSSLKQGMSMADVIAKLGKPARADLANPENASLMYYFGDAPPNIATNWHVSGLYVYLRANKVTSWSLIHSQLSKPLPNGKESSSVKDDPFDGPHHFMFTVVSETNLIDGVYFDSPEFPHLGYIGGSSYIMIDGLEDIEFKSGDKPKQVIVSLKLRQSDSAAFSGLVKSNRGKKIFIIFDLIGLAAPAFAPDSEEIISFPVDEDKLPRKVRERMRSMIARKK